MLDRSVFKRLKLKKRWIDALVGVSDLPEFKTKLNQILSRKDSTVRSELISIAGPAERRFKKEKRHADFKKRGYSVECVSRKNRIPYVFSVGLSNRVGYELILSYPGNPTVMEDVVEHVCEAAVVGVGKAQLVPDKVSTIPDINVNGEPLRFVIRKKEEANRVIRHKAPVMASRRYVQQKPNQVYQILMGDCNNLLPGEDGYEETHVQDLFCTAHQQSLAYDAH